MEDAINYEVDRQIRIIEDGGEIRQETRLYNGLLYTLKTLGLRGKGLMSKIKGLLTLVLASAQAFILLAQKRPNMVIGFGGYAAGPVGAVAKVLGIPLLIHEQNAVAGTTNRLLAKHARRVMAGFDGAFLRDINVSVTGNPLRAAGKKFL